MSLEYKDNICFIQPEYRQIDVTNAGKFGEELTDALENGEKFVLDLRNVEFIDSSGLGKIVSSLRSVNSKGQALSICGVNQTVKVLFNMVRLSQIASICESKEQAIETIQQG